MIAALLLAVMLGVVMLLPYLPGRFDASAATLSFLVQVGAYASLLLAPAGLVWLFDHARRRLWYGVLLMLAGLIALVITIAAVSMNQLALGLMFGLAAAIVLRTAARRSPEEVEHLRQKRSAAVAYLVFLPIVLVMFRSTVLRPAADWSRERAIEHSAPLIAEIEAFHQRRGEYPLSLHALNRDFPTGVIGIERFYYEPSGEAYNVFFTRQHIELDAQEVVLFNPRGEHRFASHELDLLQYEGAALDVRRGDRRRTTLAHPYWISILFD